MAIVRIALANLPYPANRDDSVDRVVTAIGDASAAGAMVVCFPECYVPGYRTAARGVDQPDAAFLERAWATVATAAGRSRVTVVLGTERDHRARRADHGPRRSTPTAPSPGSRTSVRSIRPRKRST